MKIRAIPFGYKYENGQIVTDESAADIVREVFSQYTEGKSLLAISNLLNQMHIEYRPGVIGWNKARIKRIIEDIRYTGNGEYPQIISDEIAEHANEIKSRRNNQKDVNRDHIIYRLNATVHCPCCGSVMKRIFEPRDKISERWRCQSSDCNTIIPISDETLLSEIQGLINTLISNPDLITSDEANDAANIQIHRLENELKRMLDKGEVDKELFRNKLHEIVSLRYNGLSTNKYATQILRDVFREQQPKSEFPTELFYRTVMSIGFDLNQSVTITIINGQIIRKEKENGTD